MEIQTALSDKEQDIKYQTMQRHIESLLMSSEEFRKINYSSPYYYIIKKPSALFSYFGDNHSHNPQDSQYTELSRVWSEFLVQTEDYKRIVFIEGGLRRNVDTLAGSIKNDSTAGAMTYTAKQNGIEIISPDSNDQEFRSLLEPEFTKDEIQYYFFGRMVDQYSRMPSGMKDFEEYLNQSLAKDKALSKWSEYDFSIENMKIVHKSLFGSDFDENDHEFFKDISDPHLDSRVSQVARGISKYRDIAIVEEIVKHWKLGYSIFCVFGSSHAIVQEKVLKNLLV